MVISAEIKLWGESVGAVLWDSQRELAGFQYTHDFLSRGWEIAPLKMPLRYGDRIYSFPELRAGPTEQEPTFRGLPGLVSDSLPDRYGNQLIKAWLARQGRPESSVNPVELLCFIGSRGMGALQYEPSVFKTREQASKIELENLVEVSRKILSERENFEVNLKKEEETAMRDILKIGTSAGGARPKAIIAFNEKTGQVRSGQTNAPAGFRHWIIKLDAVSDAQFGKTTGYGRVEMAYYNMARNCGIEMMQSRLLEENDRAHFMTQRFDREGNHTRHHIQTFCALQHFDLKDIRSYSYEQLFQTMRLLRLPYPQADQLYRRMVFNVLARNCDDHTKNFAFLMKQEQSWQLAPAYDICHAYRPGSAWVAHHALSINGKRTNITQHDLLEVARSMNIKGPEQIISEVDEAVSRWNEFAEEVRVETTLRDTIGKTLLSFN